MIRNPNIARRVAFHKVFEKEDIENGISKISSHWENGAIDDDILDIAIRRVEVQGLSFQPDLWGHLWTYIAAANQTFWKFELDGMYEEDPPQLLRYTTGRHYDWHIDHDSQSCTRKLTCILQLSDSHSYGGGDLCFFPALHNCGPNDWRARGTLIIFPVYVPHCITKIDFGERRCVVFWIHGPSFR